MIYTERKVTIKNDVATIDMPIILFRGDREVEIQFTIIDSKFKFESTKGNVIDKTQATYGQLAVALPDGTDLFTDIVETQNGVVTFSISGEMIDEIHEVGFYSFHIRLYNDDKSSRITLPPVMEGIEIREPLIIESDVENTDLVGDATVGYSMIQDRGVEEPVFDEDGNYIPTVWDIGDKITAEKLNKIEETLGIVPYDDINSYFGDRYTYEYALMSPSKTLKVVYSTQFTSGATLSDTYCTYECDVQANEVYIINTRTLTQASYAAVLFYNDDAYVDCVGKNKDANSATISELEFVIPEGVNKLRMTTETYYEQFKLVRKERQIIEFKELNNKLTDLLVDGVQTTPSFAYEIINDDIKVIYKMKDIDFMVELKPYGGNGLFDFYQFGYIVNDKDVPSNRFDNVNLLKRSYTDWHSPFQISAKNNIDGTNLNDNGDYRKYFTGGCHQYNNGGNGSVPTARLASVEFLVDNKIMSDSRGYGNRLEIKWVNYIQGYNTTKDDGTGREILKTNHILTFDGYNWNSHVELVPLEDINMLLCYGFQTSYSDLWEGTVRYVGGSNRTLNLASENSASRGDVNSIIVESDSYGISVEVDKTYDVGALKIAGIDNAFTVSTNKKTYFYLISNLDMIENEHYCYRGIYRFYKK